MAPIRTLHSDPEGEETLIWNLGLLDQSWAYPIDPKCAKQNHKDKIYWLKTYVNQAGEPFITMCLEVLFLDLIGRVVFGDRLHEPYRFFQRLVAVGYDVALLTSCR